MEAALVRGDLAAIRLALQRGADPNLPVWKQERSSAEKHCALSFAISEGRREIAETLLGAGASAAGTDFTAPNYPLYMAIKNGWDDLAERLLQGGARLRGLARLSDKSSAPLAEAPEFPPAVPLRPPGSAQAPKSEVAQSRFRRLREYFGHDSEELDWACETIGNIIPLAPILEKQAFHWGHAQGGQFTTILNVVVGNVDRLKRYESLGLDTRLTPEELCTAIDLNAFEGLLYLLSKHATDKREQALEFIRLRKPAWHARPC
jgi:hypothetical protein